MAALNHLTRSSPLHLPLHLMESSRGMSMESSALSTTSSSIYSAPIGLTLANDPSAAISISSNSILKNSNISLKKNKLSPPNNRRSSSDSGRGWRESRSERRTSDTGFAAQAYDESESRGPPRSRTRTVSPQAYRSHPARASFSRPLDNSPSLSSQSSAYPVNQQFTSRQSPSPIRNKLSIRRQRSRSPSPARPYSSRRLSKSPSPPRRPRQASSRPSLSISTAYQESESQNREIEEENKKGRSKMSSKTKQEQKSFAFE